MKTSLREVVGLMVDCDFEMEDFETLLPYVQGELQTLVENQLMKMDEAEEERKQEQRLEGADAARDWADECKGDMQREGGL